MRDQQHHQQLSLTPTKWIKINMWNEIYNESLFPLGGLLCINSSTCGMRDHTGNILQHDKIQKRLPVNHQLSFMMLIILDIIKQQHILQADPGKAFHA